MPDRLVACPFQLLFLPAPYLFPEFLFSVFRPVFIQSCSSPPVYLSSIHPSLHIALLLPVLILSPPVLQPPASWSPASTSACFRTLSCLLFITLVAWTLTLCLDSTTKLLCLYCPVCHALTLFFRTLIKACYLLHIIPRQCWILDYDWSICFPKVCINFQWRDRYEVVPVKVALSPLEINSIVFNISFIVS